MPPLRTPRLSLSPPQPHDLADMAAMWADPVVYAAIGGRAFTREEVWQRLLRYIGHWQAVGYGSYVIRRADGGRFVGEAGLMDSRRATVPSFEGTPEAGWALSPAAHGQGYAAEALGAILAQADAAGTPRTVCIIAPGNAASIRLAGRLGYRAIGEVTYRDAPTMLFERPAPPPREARNE